MFKKIASWFKALFTKENAKKLAKEVKKTMVATTSATVNEFVNDRRIRRRRETPGSPSQRTGSTATTRSTQRSGG